MASSRVILAFFFGLFAGSCFQSTLFLSGSHIDRKNEKCLSVSCGNQERIGKDGCPVSEGLEKLPAGLVESSSDLYLRRSWGSPDEDLPHKPKGLIAISAGIKQKQNVDAMLKKFPEENFSRIIFHYDNKVTEWEDLEWSSRAIHVAGLHQIKWWFAKRFLHPSVVREYEYIFVWDEDLGVDNFDGTRYMEIVKRHKVEISQPGIEAPSSFVLWPITRRLPNPSEEVHFFTRESRRFTRRCNGSDPSPPCGGFVEIMAPVFSWHAWYCIWHMIQNDLVHGWGIDFRLGTCVNGLAGEKIGVVDTEWVEHQGLVTLGNGVNDGEGKDPRTMVRERCAQEAKMFNERWELSTMQDKLLS